MVLPESAASTDPELASSVPYGSLRDSKFAHPGFGFERIPAQSSLAPQSTNFQPQSLPAYGGIGSYFNINNNNLSRNSSHSGIGSLIEESDENGGITQSQQTDSVSGIAQIFNSGFQLSENNNHYSGAGGLGTAVFHQPLRDGTANNNYDAPLSSSLTALDILTRIRLSPEGGTTTAPSENRMQADLDHQQQLEQQTAPRTHHLHQFGPHYTQHSHDADEELDDNNPDTFEAFDFELDD
jgi:hypothetical protein